MRLLRMALLCLVSVFLLATPVYANEGDQIFDEQQSAAQEDADSAYDSVTDKLEPDNIYDSVKDQMNKNKGENPFKLFLRGFYSAYGYIRSLGPVIAICGIVLGTLIAIFSRKNKSWKKFGITIAVAVPILVLVIIFGVGYLNSVFLH